jgi:superoxide dismutase
MNNGAMNMFLSEDNIKRHLDHLRTYRLKLSIVEKSFPDLKGRGIREILRMNIAKDVKDEIVRLSWQIKSHECFFNSFTDQPHVKSCKLKHYSSKEKFIYDLFLEAREKEYGFLYVYKDKYDIPRYRFSDENDGAFIHYQPKLALDLYEHTYFNDYRFKKEEFLRRALNYLNLERLN